MERNADRAINEDPNFESMKKIQELKEGKYGKIEVFENKTDSQKIAIKSFYNRNHKSCYISIYDSIQSHLQKKFKAKHPCILPILNFHRKEPSCPLAISIPFMENGSLADILQNRNNNDFYIFLNDTWKAITVAGIVIGMKYLHGKGIYHGNLTPSNILINKKGYPMISDYICYIEPISRIITMIKDSDITYVAPEMYNGCSFDAIQKADIYSFAFILYEILADHSAFSQEISSEQLKEMILNGERPEIPNSINPLMREIISKCWSANPDERMKFNEIYNKLQTIDFSITQNVDVNIVKQYINYIFDTRKMTVNFRLLNGQIHQMDVCLDDLILDIQQRISKIANIPIDKFILTHNNIP